MFIYKEDSTVPHDLTSVVIDPSVGYIRVSAFSNQTKLAHIFIPSTVTHIADSAFSGCVSLAYISLPSSLTFIGDHVFENCKELIYVNIPQHVTYIGDHAFYGCDALLSSLNHYRDIFTLSKNRFANFPLHQICSSPHITIQDIHDIIQDLSNEYNTDDTHPSGTNTVSTTARPTTDAWGLTPLHVLVCNCQATSDMIELILNHCSKIAYMQTLNGKTASQLFKICKGEAPYHLNLCVALKLGMKWIDVQRIISCEQSYSLQQGVRDEMSGFYPFMIAALNVMCDLDSVYNLALYNINLLSPMCQYVTKN